LTAARGIIVGEANVNLATVLFLLALDAATFGPGGRFRLEQSRDSFGERAHGVVETIAPGRTKFYPLPQSTAADYRRLRTEDLRINPFQGNDQDRKEVIGPHQVEDGRLWFGNSYYDGEGDWGVGAFGYFDTTTRTYTIYRPRELARYEASAILVEPETVWVALDRFGEGDIVPGGLVEWDRTTHAIRKYALEFVIESIRREGDALRLKNRYGGYALLRGGEVQRFSRSGRLIKRFPPPPSHN
jgi:hypothetical protein